MTGERLGVVIADVTGKGVASALIAANLQAAIRLLMPQCTDLAALACELNRLIFHNTDVSRFITAILAVVDFERSVLDLVNAGHHPPIQICGSELSEITPGESSLPFGIDEETSYRCTPAEIGGQSRTLFFYTDGLNEAMDEHEAEYGIERIFETLREHTESNPQDLLDVVRQSVTAFSGSVPQRDDITLIALRT